MKKRILSICAVLCMALVAMAEGKAKYVFYFIGDGMGVNQVNGTETYLAALEGRIGTSITPEGEMTANVLLEALGTTLEPDLLVEALTHRSFSHEHEGAKNYERLEFLGDAVLELVSTETLYKVHPDMNEGQLAKMRAKAVSEESLSKIAREKLHVGPYILLGHGEAEQGGADKSSILCDIVESLIGATFIQHGIDQTIVIAKQNEIDQETVIPETYRQRMFIRPPVYLVQIPRRFDRCDRFSERDRRSVCLPARIVWYGFRYLHASSGSRNTSSATP